MEENASNALLMAGGVLIGIMIISLGVIIFQVSAQFARNYEIEREQIELTSFNSQFEKYAKNDVTFQEIVTVANLAREINTENNIPMDKTRKSDYISDAILITVQDSSGILGKIKMEQLNDSDIIDLLKYEEKNGNKTVSYVMKDKDNDNSDYGLCKYESVIEYNENTRKVKAMTFTKKS